MWKDVFGKEHRYGPPEGWVMPATEQFSSQEEWPKLVARGVHFPEYDGPFDLTTTRGTCLNPLLWSKDAVYRTRPVAPDEQLVDGALYIISRDWADEESVEEYTAKTGLPKMEKKVFMNFLRFACFEWWTVCNEGVGKLEILPGLQIIAMVVGVTTLGACAPSATARQSPCGNPFDAMSVVCADTPQSRANAFTSVVTSSLSGVAGSFTSPQTSGSITVGPFQLDTTVILTVTGQWSFTFTGVTVTNMVLRYGISATTGTFAGALVTVDTSTQANSSTPGLGPLAQEIQVPLLAGTTATYNVLSGENPSGIVGTSISISGIIKAEVIKR
jgi:hypothetical protein